jgi:tetratricopeptide (TPR) repeat protein
MRRLLEELRERIARFIPQRDAAALVVHCSEADAALVSKIIEGLDDASDSELFWIVVDEFKTPDQFAESCVQVLAIKHGAVRLAQAQKKLTPWPEFPADVLQPGRLPPLERLKRLAIFSRSLLPILDGALVVWAFFPLKITDQAGYANLMAQLWKHEYPFPWCHHLRLIFRDDSATGALTQAAKDIPTVEKVKADFSTEALRKAAEDDAGDENVPLPERINNTLVLAGMDYAHRKYDQAMRAYEIVHRYAMAANVPVLGAIALQGMADVHSATGRKDEAGKMLQAALAPAAAASSPPVPILFNLYHNLGALRYEEQKWEEAEVYFQGAAEFALLQRDPQQRLHCWEMMGWAQYQQNKIEPALKTLSNGAIVAGKLKMQGPYEKFVHLINGHYEKQKDERGQRDAIIKIQEAIAAHEKEEAARKAAAPAGRRPDGVS